MTTGAGGPHAFDLAISVVIPCKGGATHLQDCLDGLARQDLDRPFEVIVVDGWMDDEVATVARAYEFVTCLRSTDNLIQARARNLGAERARSGFLAFTDCDCVPDTGWLRAAVTALDSGVRLAGGPILDALPDNLFAVADNFIQCAEFPERRPEGAQAHFGGGNLALRREDFFTVGGFPDTAVGEDTLLSRAVGVRFPADTLRFRPDMRVRHRGRETRAEFLAHQRSFGLTRGEQGISVSPLKHRMARRTIMLPAVVSFRLSRMLACTLRWAPQRIPTILRALPLITWGLWHWALGFRDGSRAFDPTSERQFLSPRHGSAPKGPA